MKVSSRRYVRILFRFYFRRSEGHSTTGENCGRMFWQRTGLTYLQIPGTEVVRANSRKVADSEVTLGRDLLAGQLGICWEIPASPVNHSIAGRPHPVKSASQSATWKAAENDCLTRRNLIRPCVPSHVAYKAERGGNEPFWSPWTMYPHSQKWHWDREATMYLAA